MILDFVLISWINESDCNLSSEDMQFSFRAKKLLIKRSNSNVVVDSSLINLEVNDDNVMAYSNLYSK